MNPAIVVALLAGLVGIVYIIWQFRNVLSKDPGNEKMQEIAAAIQKARQHFSIVNTCTCLSLWLSSPSFLRSSSNGSQRLHS